jgi:hypothetical protein
MLSQAHYREAWAETQQAAHDAMHTVDFSLYDGRTLEGAQLYCHSWSARMVGPRLGGVLVGNFEAWDPRRTIRDGQGRTWEGPRPVWLNVHVIERRRDQFVEDALEPGC